MRKRDDPHQGFLYRVVCRKAGSNDEWEHTSYGHYGQPRTYMTLSAARGMRTRMERFNFEYGSRATNPTKLEFRVERAPVTGWEVAE